MNVVKISTKFLSDQGEALLFGLQMAIQCTTGRIVLKKTLSDNWTPDISFEYIFERKR